MQARSRASPAMSRAHASHAYGSFMPCARTSGIADAPPAFCPLMRSCVTLRVCWKSFIVASTPRRDPSASRVPTGNICNSIRTQAVRVHECVLRQNGQKLFLSLSHSNERDVVILLLSSQNSRFSSPTCHFVVTATAAAAVTMMMMNRIMQSTFPALEHFKDEKQQHKR